MEFLTTTMNETDYNKKLLIEFINDVLAINLALHVINIPTYIFATIFLRMINYREYAIPLFILWCTIFWAYSVNKHLMQFDWNRYG